MTCAYGQSALADGGGEGGSFDASLDGGAGDGSADGPPACDENGDPATQPCAINDRVAVYVDPTNGVDTNDGTRAHPLLHLTAALGRVAGARNHIHACGGPQPYAESLTINVNDVSLYGGFSCDGGTWVHHTEEGLRAVITPTTGDPALVVDGAEDIYLADFTFIAGNSSGASGSSSVGGVVANAKRVTVARASFTAKAGVDGASGGAPDAVSSPAPAGDPGQPLQGAGAKENKCPRDSSTSTGGAGGGPGGRGVQGQPSYATPIPNGATGAAGKDVANGCNGIFGSDGRGGSAGVGAATPLTILKSGWVAVDGQPGGLGAIGQGGGGGTGISAGGGGGGAGGCGGAGGAPGKGGGSSLALLVVSSPGAAADDVELDDVTLTASNAGAGGNGGAGQAGQPGGGPGGPGGSGGAACAGASGGAGGSGGGGGGGGGGISAALAWHGSAPLVNRVPADAASVDTSHMRIGDAIAAGGNGGKKGPATSAQGGNPAEDGAPGVPGVTFPRVAIP